MIMIDALVSLGHGFGVALTPMNLLFILIGVCLGQLIGALPGLGPSAGMALLLPVTFGIPPATAIMMLAGIMYGGMYGGTLTSVLVNVPGEAASVMTAVDGHKLAKQGRLAEFALKFSSPEYFLLATLGITATASIGAGSPLKAIMTAIFGLMIALVGTDPILGTARLTFGTTELLDGIDFLPVAIGIFGIAEVLSSLEQSYDSEPIKTRLRDMWLSAADWAECRMAILRGGTLGFLIGLMPGAGPTVAAILAYVTEKRFSKHPERFGEGAIDGVAAAESANNSAAHGALIPMLALGIPGSASTAVLLAALVLQGIRPGPTLLVEQADLVWGLVASMFIGNVILLVLNLPLAPAFGALLRIPYEYLAPGILVLSRVGTYATTLSLFSVGLTLFFGMVGYLMMKADLPRAPVVLAVVLAQLMETSLRQSLMLSEGTLWIFLERPLSIVLLLLVIGSLALPLLGLLTRHRTERRRRAEAKISIATE
jgi:putative tricarboxylic transport membrane protein